MAIYESVYILKTDIEDEQEQKIVDDLRSIYKKTRSKIISDLKWGKRPLPYLVKNEKEGVFYYFLWECSGGNAVGELQKKVRVTDRIIRSFHVRIDDEIKRYKKKYLAGKNINILGTIKNDGKDKEDVDTQELVYLEPTAVYLVDEY